MKLQWLATLLRARRDERGNIAVMSALTTTVLFMFAAYGVDEASIYFDELTLQGNTDIAAIVAANNLSKAQSAALLSLQDNNVNPSSSDTTVKVETGRYTPDISLTINQRFAAGASNPNAARVTVQKTGKLFFASFFATPPDIEGVAVARKQTLGSFSLGSRLVSLNGGVLNGVLSGILGTNLSLSVLDYQALSGANVDLPQMLDALAAEKNINVGTYQSLLQNSISYSDLAHALSQIGSLSSPVSGILRNISQQTTSSSVNVPLANLLDLGSMGNLAINQPHGAVQATANILDVLNAAALLGGQHQVQVDLGANIPGLTQTTFTLEIGQLPQNSSWLQMVETGTMIFTAQTRLRLIVQVGGTGLLAGMTIRLPLYIDLAAAQATLTNVQCTSSNAPQSMSVAVQPGLVGMWIGDVDPTALMDLSQKPAVLPGTMINVPLLKVTGSAQTQMGNQTATTVNFSASDISAHTVKTVSTSDYTSSLTGSLLNNLNLQVNAIGLGLNASAVATALNATLAPLTPSIDKVIANILTLAGVKIGQADVWPNGVDCSNAVLVQ